MKPRYLTPLSRIQITQLCAQAGLAYKAAKARGGIEDGMKLDDFRKAGQFEAAKVTSLKLATQEHYLAILGKWWTVMGNLEEAFYAFLNAGAENEAARQMRWRLAGQVSRLAEGIAQKHDDALMNAQIQQGVRGTLTITRMPADEAARQAWAYAKSLAKDKFAGRFIESLNADELEQLGFTVFNRASQKLGKGDKSRRNKSQRRGRKAVDSDEESTRREEPLPPASGPSMMARMAAKVSPEWARIPSS
ncbi:MAG: hypothetical protein V4662_25160 [Verrucomicrobiota bacterium]